jgi:phosphatidylethanolamine/phosphatidyl-N-methylethanolamine N-methyltransferase
MNNKWNRVIYKLWSPIYDAFFNNGPFLKARKTIFNHIAFQPGDKILFVGVGTGADIQQIPYEQMEITAIDYSEDMLHKAKQNFPGSSITFLQMDAQELVFSDETFDYVIGSLILSVVPDGPKTLKEMIRVTKGAGYIVLFDKFAPSGTKSTLMKRMLRGVIKVLGTDIGRSFAELWRENRNDAQLIEDKEIMFNGMYRKIVLKKNISTL